MTVGQGSGGVLTRSRWKLCLLCLLCLQLAAAWRPSLQRLPRLLRRSTALSATRAIVKTSPVTSVSALTPGELRARNADFLADVWGNVSFPRAQASSEADYDGDETEFRLVDYAFNRSSVKPVLEHFQLCKDCAADDAIIIATQDTAGRDVLLLSKGNFKLFSDEADEDGEVWEDIVIDESLLGGPADAHEKIRPVFREETSDAQVLALTQQWVQHVIADFNVCPFAATAVSAGVPAGGVSYRLSRAVRSEEAFMRFWEEIRNLLRSTATELSSVLLVFPELDLFGDYELFEVFCDCLNDAMSSSSLGFEEDIQLMYFHPKFQFRDGHARAGEQQGAANYARRSPWPMIAMLRANQVRVASKGIPHGQVAKSNEERLNAVGTRALQSMLETDDWSALPSLPAHEKRDIMLAYLEQGERFRLAEEVARGRANAPPSQCPFAHQQQQSDQQLQQQPAAAVLSEDYPAQLTATIKEDQRLSFTDNHDPSLSSFLQTLLQGSDEYGLDRSGAVMSEDELLRLADEVDKWISADS